LLKDSFKILTFLLFILSSVSLGAQERLSNDPKDEHSSSKNQDNKNDEQWINDLHETISDSVYQSAAWFDNFFTDDGNSQKNPKVNARIRLEWRPKSRAWDEVKARFKVKVKLPHFKNKLDLILSDDDDSDQNQLPLETIKIRSDEQEEHFSASLRYLHKVEKNKFTDARLGISGGDMFIRARHRRHIQWDDRHAFKVEPSIYYFVKDGLGSKLLLEYDHQYDKNTQFRINYSIRGSQSFSGIRWKHGFYKLKHLDSTTATVMSFQVQGERNGARGFVVDNYTLSYRYRFNAYKKWLYFEIEPFLEWPEQEGYSTTPGIALRIEGNFYKG